MFKNLSPGAVGIRGLGLVEAVNMARRHGFAGVELDIRRAAELASEHGSDHVVGLFAGANVLPGHWGLPIDWRESAGPITQAALDELAALAELARDLGCDRASTWVLPFSETMPYDENFAWHAERFRPIARVLAEQGCRLGLEFIGPKTLRDPARYPFVYTLGGMMELAGAIGTGNVGLLLDAFHLYTSGGSIEDLDSVTVRDIVVVHVNDAIAGVSREAQDDHKRELPLATGVIDLVGFMRKLEAMGYDGPVTIEPFLARFIETAETDPDAVAAETKQALDALWRASGLE